MLLFFSLIFAAHTAINPYYYAPATTYAASILPYVAPIAPVAPKPVVDTPEVAAAKPYLADSGMQFNRHL